MINSEVAKSLKLITKPAYVAVTGVGGVTSAYAQGRATFDIVSRCNPEVQIAVDALISSRVTKYVPSHRRFGDESTHLEGLLFADGYTDESLTSTQKSFSATFGNLQTTMLWHQ